MAIELEVEGGAAGWKNMPVFGGPGVSCILRSVCQEWPWEFIRLVWTSLQICPPAKDAVAGRSRVPHNFAGNPPISHDSEGLHLEKMPLFDVHLGPR